MELLIIYIITIIVSYVIDFSTALKMFRIVFDEGYKITLKECSELVDLNPKFFKYQKLFNFGLGINVAYSIYQNVTVDNLKFEFINGLLVMGVLEPMTNEEIEVYQKNPGFLGALEVLSNTEQNSRSNEIKEIDRNKELEDRNKRLEDRNKRLDDIYQKMEQLKKEKLELLQQRDIEQAESISSKFSKNLKELREKEKQLDEQLSNLETETKVNKTLKNIKL